MKKSTKGALAAAAASALLLGGAGSLAFWTADATLSGTGLASGELKLINTDCNDDDGANSGFYLDSGESLPGTLVTADTKLVPGDTITKVCTSTIVATGDHLRAVATITGAGTTPDSVDPYVTVNTESVVSGNNENLLPNGGTITEANNGDTLTSTVSLTFKPGSGNESQASTGTLADYNVLLTQTHN